MDSAPTRAREWQPDLDLNLFFQALLGRFLSENLPDCSVRPEHSLTDMMRYSPGLNPRRRKAPRPRPDFAVFSKAGSPQLLDAKYRDLWEHELPRDMLYQLSVYALSQPPRSTAAILYPTTSAGATEAAIEIADPVRGGTRAYVALRPVVVSQLVAVLGDDDAAGARGLAEALVRGSRLTPTGLHREA